MRERDGDPLLFTLLVKALETLALNHGPLVMSGFMLKMLAHEGLEPFLEQCVRCGAKSELVAFDIGEGGVLCSNCRRGRSITPDALRLLRLVLGGGLAKALAEPESLATVEVEHLAVEMMEYHIERRLKSLAVLAQT
jgi:DNA repair protein RecO (recombination protein O)